MSHPRPRRARFRSPARIAAALLLALASAAGCARLGPLAARSDGALVRDAARLAPADEAGPGSLAVEALRVRLARAGQRFSISLYRPQATPGPLAAVVFLPGLLAPADQYESTARALASRGFLVAIRDRYGPFLSDRGLAA